MNAYVSDNFVGADISPDVVGACCSISGGNPDSTIDPWIEAGSKDDSDGNEGKSNNVGCQADTDMVKERPSEGLSGTLMLDATVSEQQIEVPYCWM